MRGICIIEVIGPIDLNYFFFFGVVDLIILTYQDLKDKKVNARYNWFMTGIVGSLIAVQHPPITYAILLIGIAVFFNIITKKVFAKGDKTAFSWIIAGSGLISLPRLLLWFIFFSLYAAVYFISKKILHISGKTPFYPVILGSFITIAIIFV